ncbi:hypothetical protein [Paenibacillus xanthanilyticus]|uniref:Uncharacterized protein n=1 Tax=Paenibacillus xanthanilyticus TaxID=1783531 RepID=A0ABV8KBQ7_9BACL
MLRKLRGMGKEIHYTGLSFASLLGVVLLHLVHWLAAPLLFGAAAGMHMNHHAGMGGASSGGDIAMGVLMLALFVINLVSMYYAIRQLALAWRQRGTGANSRHTYWCSAVSMAALVLGVYTTLSI